MSSDYIEAAKSYHCEHCEHHKPLAQTLKVASPKKFSINHEIGIDCLEAKDSSGERRWYAIFESMPHCAPTTLACMG
eukprot:4547382-Pyramimonas_sp.AAC.1